MTATNHTLTGSVFIAATVTHVPLLLTLPAAFLLHFVLDALPHFGQLGKENEARSLARLKWFLPIDAGLAAAVLLTVFVVHPAYWWAIMVGGILCASPDLWSFGRFRRFLRSGDASYSTDWFAQFHHRIQWGERPWGIWIELAWAICFAWLLWANIH